MKLSAIKPNLDNPRKIEKHRLDALTKSISEFEKMMTLRPIIVDENMTILGGNQRYAALKKLGYKDIPDEWVKKATDLTEEEKRRFILTDNANNYGEWDMDLLATWDATEIEGWDLDIQGFGEIEEVKEATEDDYEQPAEIETDIKRGDIISFIKDGKELHRIMCGDSTDKGDVEKLMQGEKADMVFTDPPYGVDYSEKNEFLNKFDKGNSNQKTIEGDTPEVNIEQLWELSFTNIREALKKGASFYITFSGDKLLLLLLQILKQIKLPERQILVWVKNNHVLGRSTYQYKHEMILFGWKEGAGHKFYSNFDTTVWEVDKPLKNDLHPTMKPVELINKALTNSSKPSDLVLDLFLGSGTTMVACHQLDRRCVGMEIDPHYCQIIINRMLKLDPNLHIETR